MIDKIKKWFKKGHKKTYVANLPDWITLGYWGLGISFVLYIVIRLLSNQNLAVPSLFFVPLIAGLLVALGVLILLPVRAIAFFITEVLLRVYLFKLPKNTPAETVVVIGKNEYFQPAFWTRPNYDTDLLLIVEYLRMLGKPFSIYYDTAVETLDKIMADKKIRVVYLVGHGRRHGFAINSRTVVDYCRYNGAKFKKDFVYQIHCNGGRGTSLVEYVVPPKNQAKCLPEHGLMSNLTINQMFIDKIIRVKGYTGLQAFFEKTKYELMTTLLPFIALAAWILIFSKLVA